MQSNSIDGKDLVRVVKTGCMRLELNRDEVNLLNVFPVPDGDTGTNMYLTLLSAVKEGEKHANEPVSRVARAISMGSLMGARGNSGVILSQIFRGMAKVLEDHETIDAVIMAEALKSGTETAYKAVMKPVEGTILTVIRMVSEACEEAALQENDLLKAMLYALKEGYKTLEKTPQMLPVLKEAGVVDAGGQGLLYFLEGLTEGIASDAALEIRIAGEKVLARESLADFKESVDLEYHYCTELLIKGSGLDAEAIKLKLGSLGDSMLVVGGDDLVKVHIHSNNPGQVLETALGYGSISDVKINNMVEEVHEHRLLQAEEAAASAAAPEAAGLDASTANAAAGYTDSDGPERKPAAASAGETRPALHFEDRIGVVAVAPGEGVGEILSSLGVEEVVEGGQTMNPSAEDLFNACKRIPTSKVIILPNNSNIILTADQVTHLCEQKDVRVVPTRSVMQAIAAMISFESEADIDRVVNEMNEEMRRIQYGEITFAVRDTTVNGLDIKAGDVLGLVNGAICCTASSRDEAMDTILEQMMSADIEIITLLYGDGVTEEEARATQERVAARYPNCEIELHYGGQAYYAYLVSVE